MSEPAPSLPPLLSGVAVTGAVDPFERARDLAARGCDGGTVVHNVQIDRLRAAIVFAPEVPLEDAMAMLPVCAVGFQNALGALAPPEVAVHLTWDGGILVNGARCGRFRVAASGRDPAEVPDWLIVGLEVAMLQAGSDPGLTPDTTALYDEGCAGVAPLQLLESWSRHTLVWINRWSEGGNAPVHGEWIGLLHGVAAAVERDGMAGTFLGTDDRFGMLICDRSATHLVPLSSLLRNSP